MRQLILGSLGCLALFGVAAWAQAPSPAPVPMTGTVGAPVPGPVGAAPQKARPVRQVPVQNAQPLPGGQGGGPANLGLGGGAGGGPGAEPPPGLNTASGQYTAFPPTLTSTEPRPEKHVDTLIDFNRGAIDYRKGAVDHAQGAIDYTVRSDAGAPN